MQEYADSTSLGATLGIRTEERTPERVVMVMDVTPRLHQPHGLLHGGASLALAETAASVAANLNCAEGYVALGQEINANHIRGARAGTLRAVASPLHVGRSSQVWSIEIKDDAGRLICISRCTLAVVKRPEGAPQGFE